MARHKKADSGISTQPVTSVHRFKGYYTTAVHNIPLLSRVISIVGLLGMICAMFISYPSTNDLPVISDNIARAAEDVSTSSRSFDRSPISSDSSKSSEPTTAVASFKSTADTQSAKDNIKTESTSTSSDGKWGGLDKVDVNAMNAPVPMETPAAPAASSSRSSYTSTKSYSSSAYTSPAPKAVTTTAPAHASNHPTGDSGNAYPFSQCTWWVYIRRHQLGLPVGSYFGNGAQWASSARSLGYWVDNTPRFVGDIMVFAAGQDASDPVYGHVAVVEKINSDGSVVTSESGSIMNGSTFSRTIYGTSAYQFIHY